MHNGDFIVLVCLARWAQEGAFRDGTVSALLLSMSHQDELQDLQDQLRWESIGNQAAELAVPTLRKRARELAARLGPARVKSMLDAAYTVETQRQLGADRRPGAPVQCQYAAWLATLAVLEGRAP